MAFGGAATVAMTGLLGKFDVRIDILKALPALTNPTALLDAISVPGKFGLDVATLQVVVPNVVTVNATGIHVNYDPTYNPAKHNNTPAPAIVQVQSASITFPTFGVTGLIGPDP